MYWIKHFFWNLKQLRFFSPNKYPDTTGKTLRWRDLLACTIGSWKMHIPDLLRRIRIPRSVVFVGAWMTKQDVINMNEYAEKAGLEKIAKELLSNDPPNHEDAR